MGDERGRPETGIWTRVADSYPAQPGEYRPRRAKPEPPDPYLPRSEHPLRSGPYLRPGSSSASDRFAAPRPDPLRDPIPPPDPAPPRGQAGQPVPGGAFGWWDTNGNVASGRHPDGPVAPGAAQRMPRRAGPPDSQRPPGREQPTVRQRSAWDQPAREHPAREQPAREQPAREHPARDQAAREQAAREQPAEWHTGRRDTQDDPVPVRPGGAPADGLRPDVDRYPADFPTQVFMSSALAAWQQPAQAAPAGNWPQVGEASPGARPVRASGDPALLRPAPAVPVPRARARRRPRPGRPGRGTPRPGPRLAARTPAGIVSRPPVRGSICPPVRTGPGRGTRRRHSRPLRTRPSCTRRRRPRPGPAGTRRRRGPGRPWVAGSAPAR